MDINVKTEEQIIVELFTSKWKDLTGTKIGGWGNPTQPSYSMHLPKTELTLAKYVGELLKGTAVYVKTESAWFIWDDLEFRRTEGDWFIHKVIKEVAYDYQCRIDTVISRAKMDRRARTDDDNADDPLAKYSEHFRLNGKLQSSSCLDALTKILKSELDEIPAELVKETSFLGIEHLDVRTTQVPFVTDFIPSVGIGQLYGRSYTGKTYFTLDLALSICAGLPNWMGKTLNVSGPSTVVYIAAEGGQPFWDAVEGWKTQHPDADLSGFKVLDSGAGQNVNITGKESAPGVYGLGHLRAQIKSAGLSPSLVVFDPQANILSGVDENSNSEMMAALNPIQKWANEDNFFALLVHHAGKSDTGMGRGASAQMGMMDLLVNLDKNAAGVRTLRFDKVKGASQPEQRLNFRLKTVAIPTGSGSAGVVIAGDADFTGAEKSHMDTTINRAKIMHELKSGLTSVSAMVKASGISKDKVASILDVLKAQGQAENLGSVTHPKWVLINPDVE